MQHEPSANRQAILLMALSMSALAANDAIMRYVGASVPVGQMIFIRGAALCLVLVVGCLLAKQPLPIKDVLHRWSIMRGCAEVFGTYMFLTSLTLLPIAVASTLVFASPIILTALSGPLFGERVGIWRWGAVIAGFCGILLITGPGTGLWQPAMALPLGAAVMVVLRDVCTRYVADHVSSGAVTLTTAIAVTIGGLLSWFSGWVPVDIVQVSWLSLAAIIIGTSFFTYIVAVRLGELSLIAPIQYVIILWAVFYGAIVWGEIPGLREIAGGLIIIFAGIVILYRERQSRDKFNEDRHPKGGADA